MAFPSLAFLYPNLIWALLSLVYFVFGNKIFIFNWVDSVLVFIIQYVISMLTPLIFILGLAVNFTYILTDAESNERGILSTYVILFAL